MSSDRFISYFSNIVYMQKAKTFLPYRKQLTDKKYMVFNAIYSSIKYRNFSGWLLFRSGNTYHNIADILF